MRSIVLVKLVRLLFIQYLNTLHERIQFTSVGESRAHIKFGVQRSPTYDWS